MGRIRLKQTLSSEAVKKWNSFETLFTSLLSRVFHCSLMYIEVYLNKSHELLIDWYNKKTPNTMIEWRWWSSVFLNRTGIKIFRWICQIINLPKAGQWETMCEWESWPEVGIPMLSLIPTTAIDWHFYLCFSTPRSTHEFRQGSHSP